MYKCHSSKLLLLIVSKNLSPQVVLHFGHSVKPFAVQLRAQQHLKLNGGHTVLLAVYNLKPIHVHDEFKCTVIVVAVDHLYHLFEVEGSPNVVLVVYSLTVVLHEGQSFLHICFINHQKLFLHVVEVFRI